MTTSRESNREHVIRLAEAGPQSWAATEIKRIGIERVLDRFAVWDATAGLGGIDLRRWRHAPEVVESVRLARDATLDVDTAMRFAAAS